VRCLNPILRNQFGSALINSENPFSRPFLAKRSCIELTDCQRYLQVSSSASELLRTYGLSRSLTVVSLLRTVLPGVVFTGSLRVVASLPLSKSLKMSYVITKAD